MTLADDYLTIMPSLDDLRSRFDTPIFWAVTRELGFVPASPPPPREVYWRLTPTIPRSGGMQGAWFPATLRDAYRQAVEWSRSIGQRVRLAVAP